MGKCTPHFMMDVITYPCRAAEVWLESSNTICWDICWGHWGYRPRVLSSLRHKGHFSHVWHWRSNPIMLCGLVDFRFFFVRMHIFFSALICPILGSHHGCLGNCTYIVIMDWLSRNRNEKLRKLIHLPLVPHICISKSGQHWFRHWLVAYSAPSHYLNQCWIIVNWTLRNKLLWNFIKIQNLSFTKMHLKMSSAKLRGCI